VLSGITLTCLMYPQRMDAAVNMTIAAPNTERCPQRSATHPLIGMRTASLR